jgi:excisionase family DNA binding protein
MSHPLVRATVGGAKPAPPSIPPEDSHDHALAGGTAAGQPLMTVLEVASFLRCSTKTVLALVRHEGLPGFRLRSRLRFLPGDVLQWARRRGKEVY